EIFSFHILHDQVAAPILLNKVDGRHNIWVSQLCLALPFIQEAFFQAWIPRQHRQKKLDGGRIAQMDMASLPHFGHTTFANFVFEDVLPDFVLFVHSLTCNSVGGVPTYSKTKEILRKLGEVDRRPTISQKRCVTLEEANCVGKDFTGVEIGRQCTLVLNVI